MKGKKNLKEGLENERFFRRRKSKRFFRHKKNAMIASPKKKGPGGSMPQSPKQHGQKKIAIRFKAAVPVTAKGNIKIISQPSRKRDMPAPPEIGEAGGKIRQRKIDAEFKSHPF